MTGRHPLRVHLAAAVRCFTASGRPPARLWPALLALAPGTLGVGLLPALASCDDEAGKAAGAAAATAAVEARASPRRPVPVVRGVMGAGDGEVDPEDEPNHEAACAPQGSDVKPLQLLGFRWTSAIERRDPKDTLRTVAAGERAYAHLRVRNRSGRERCVRVKFRIGGKPRPAITLRIGKSWSWRTWAYSTSRSDDRGLMEISVVDDQGNTLVSEKLPIR